jgi:hypothetical protein
MAEEKKEEKKIIVDEDWKAEAQKEKEVLAAQEEQEKEAEEAKAERGPLPKGNFAALVSMLTTQAFFAMGAFKVEGQEDREPDLELARYNIDMLETLQEKTKGNLSEEEASVLERTLHELRMTFVKMSG